MEYISKWGFDLCTVHVDMQLFAKDSNIYIYGKRIRIKSEQTDANKFIIKNICIKKTSQRREMLLNEFRKKIYLIRFHYCI